MDGAEVIGGPGHDRGHECDAGHDSSPASTPSGVPARVEHDQVDHPHQDRKQDLGIKEIDLVIGVLGDHDSGGQA